MHLEILVEDLSGKKALDIIIPEILGLAHTFKLLSAYVNDLMESVKLTTGRIFFQSL